MNDLKGKGQELKRYLYSCLNSSEFEEVLESLQIKDAEKDEVIKNLENCSVKDFLNIYEKILIIQELNKSISSMKEVDNKISSNLIELLHLFDTISNDNIIKISSKRTTANTIVNKN